MTFGWLEQRRLKVASKKTELLVTKCLRTLGDLKIEFLGHNMTPSKEIKYLGSVFQRYLHFVGRVSYTVKKPVEKTTAYRD